MLWHSIKSSRKKKNLFPPFIQIQWHPELNKESLHDMKVLWYTGLLWGLEKYVWRGKPAVFVFTEHDFRTMDPHRGGGLSGHLWRYFQPCVYWRAHKPIAQISVRKQPWMFVGNIKAWCKQVGRRESGIEHCPRTCQEISSTSHSFIQHVSVPFVRPFIWGPCSAAGTVESRTGA